MSVCVEIVVAPETEAGAVAAAQTPVESWTGFDAPGIDPVKLAHLDAIVSEHGVDTAFAGHCRMLAAKDDFTGPFVFKIPPELTERLAGVEDAGAVAERWAATEAFDGEADVDTLRGVVTELARLAVEARGSDRDLLLWMAS